MQKNKCTKLITLAELKATLQLSRSMIYLKLNPKSDYYDPFFPKRFYISKRSIRFLWDDVLAYIDRIRPEEKVVENEQESSH